MADRPKMQIVDWGGDRANHVSIFVNGVEVGEAYAEDNADGRGRTAVAVDIAKAVALALGADVEDASEPDRQPYRYFVTFTATGRITWRQPWRAILHGGTVQAGAWFDLDKDIDGPEDTQRIAESLAARYPDPTIVIITGITYVDGPC